MEDWVQGEKRCRFAACVANVASAVRKVAGVVTKNRRGKGIRMSADAVTGLLHRGRGGDGAALDAPLPLVYAELRRCADAYVRRESAALSLQATAFVHETCLKLAAGTAVDCQGPASLFRRCRAHPRKFLEVARQQSVEGGTPLRRGDSANQLGLLEDTRGDGRPQSAGSKRRSPNCPTMRSTPATRQ